MNEIFNKNYEKSVIDNQKRKILGKKEFRFDILKNTGCMPNGDFLNSLYDDYVKRIEIYRKTYGNDSDLTEIPLIMEI